jgi:hypothetical protein
MWMENGGTESFGYNLETNRHFGDQFIFDNAIKIIGGEMLTFDIFANVDLTKATQTSKKSFGSLTPKETITQASTMVDTHIKINPERRTIQRRRRRNWHDLHIASAENTHSNQQHRKSGR